MDGGLYRHNLLPAKGKQQPEFQKTARTRRPQTVRNAPACSLRASLCGGTSIHHLATG